MCDVTEPPPPKDPFDGVVRVRPVPVASRPATRLEDRVFAVALTATCIGLGTVFVYEAIAGHLSFLVALVLPGLVALWLVLFGVARRLGQAHLNRHNWLLCTRCRYPLDTLPRDSTCPECGAIATSDEIRAAWRSHYFSPPRPL